MSTTPATPATTTPAAAAATPEIMPAAATLQHAARLSLQNDKPIQLDYYVETHLGKAFLGEDVDTKERVLVKSKDEFTSTIQKWGTRCPPWTPSEISCGPKVRND